MELMHYRKTNHIDRQSFSWGWQANAYTRKGVIQFYIHYNVKKTKRVLDVFLVKEEKAYLLNSYTAHKVSTCKEIATKYIKNFQFERDIEDLKEVFEELR